MRQLIATIEIVGRTLVLRNGSIPCRAVGEFLQSQAERD
jgi:hypothetical protein